MNFRYKNRTFSILIDFVSEELIQNNDAQRKHEHGYSLYMKTTTVSHTPEKAKKLQIEVCESNDMIPCIFPIRIDDMTPLESGWNLYDTRTGEKIIPLDIADDSPRRISDWELLNFGISIVRNHLADKGYTVLSYTDAPGIMPQLWFEDDQNNKCWVQVIVNKPMEIADLSNTIAKEYKGYIEREKAIADKMHRLENIKIKGRFRYKELHEISTEGRQKLEKINPETLAQASRIPGVSPSDINVLLILLGR